LAKHRGDSHDFGIAPAILTAIGLILAIAGTLAPRQRTQLGALPARIILPVPAWLVIALLVSLSLASLILLASALRRRQRRRKKGEGENDYEIYHEPQKIPPLLVATLIVVAVAPAAGLGGAILWGRGHEPYVAASPGGPAIQHPAAMSPASPQRSPRKTHSRPASAVTSGLFGTLAVLVGFGCIGVVSWLLFADRGMRRLTTDFERAAAPLSAAVEDSLDDLRREPDARTAIIKIYSNFEHALGAAAAPRRDWQTPMEFMQSALTRLPLPLAPVAELTRLFEIARFSHHPIGPVEHQAAWRTLTEIRAVLEQQAEARRGPPS
jgi:hypothetical protein